MQRYIDRPVFWEKLEKQVCFISIWVIFSHDNLDIVAFLVPKIKYKPDHLQHKGWQRNRLTLRQPCGAQERNLQEFTQHFRGSGQEFHLQCLGDE